MIRSRAFGSWFALPLVFVLVTGCAASPTSDVPTTPGVRPLSSLPPKVKRGNENWRPSKPLPHVKMSEEEKARYRKDFLESFGYGERTVDVSKLPDLVTYISSDEVGTVISACMRQLGWDSKVNARGSGHGMDVPPGQESQALDAEAACFAMYTPDPRGLRIIADGGPSREIAEAVYEYHSGFLTKCVARYGYQLKIPAKEVHIAKQMSPSEVLDIGYPENDGELAVACPRDPPDEVIFGGPP